MQLNRRSICMVFLCVMSSLVWAVEPSASSATPAPTPAQGIGAMADSLLEVTTVASYFVSTVSIVIGGSFLFAGFCKYMQHRVNPLAVPISTVVFLVILGSLSLCLPLAYKLTEGGIPFTLH